MLQLFEGQVVQHFLKILRELGHKSRNLQEGVHSDRQSEVVSLGEDLYSVGEVALPTNSFLERGGCSSSDIDLSIKKRDRYQLR